MFGNNAVNTSRIRTGDLVWRTHDPELDKLARPWTEATTPVHKQPLRVEVTAHDGAPLVAVWSLVEQPGVHVAVQSDEPLASAQKRALSADMLREQFGRLGNTPYELADIEIDINGQPFAPASMLNDLRREAVEQLAALQSQPSRTPINDPRATLQIMLANMARPEARLRSIEPQIHLLVRTPEQLEAALDLRPASITLDYLELYGLRPAVERVQQHGIVARVASPRILKPDEQRIVRFLLKLGCDIVVRSGGLLHALQAEQHSQLIGDFSLNAANMLAADALLQLGLARLTPTHDLNAAQVAELARNVGADAIEVIAYQHLPVFHTEHCVFCRFLSDGTSYKNCGRPCEQHRVALRDQQGREHPVIADVGCRNTVFGAQAQEASRHLDVWRDAGIAHYRLEFVRETATDVIDVARAFQKTLSGMQTARDLTRQIARLAPQGTTEGSLFVPNGGLAIPLMQ